MNNLSFAFFGATNYSKELLLFLIENSFLPKVIFSIPQEFTISYSKEKVKNTNYANLKEIADKHGILYYEIDSIDGKRTKDYKDIIKELKLDLLLILGWYYMVPKDIRELTKYGAWGIHASLLPKYAGHAPLNWAMIYGEEKAGVTMFRMEDGVDNGDIIAQKSFSIEYEDSIKEVYAKATTASKGILLDILSDIKNVEFTPQNKDKIEIHPPRTPQDGEIDWNKSAVEIYNFIRAQTLPYPCAFSIINDRAIKIIDSKITDTNSNSYEVGEILNIDNKSLVATRDKFIELGVIDDGEKTEQFKEYARINSLWGGYSRGKSLKLVA